jgi:hypothetical protein
MFRRILQAESVVDSSYNAMIVQLRRRMRRGLLFDAHFTWAKAIDNGQNSATFFGFATTVFDPLNPSLDRSRSDCDIRRRFVSSFVWRPDETFSISGDTTRKIFGKWQFSGSVTAQDGKSSAGTLSGFLTTANTRPVETGSSNGTGGNFRVPFIGRNFGEAPGLAIFDLRISRSFAITEGTRLEVLAESFNLFNRVNVQSVNAASMALATAPGAPSSNYIIVAGGPVNNDTCGGQVFPDGTRCLGMTAGTDYLAPRSASSTHNGMRDIQFAVKFHW